MICLDTNYLIRALVPGTSEAEALEQWLRNGETLAMAAVAWYEFLCGCTEDEEALALALLNGGIVPFGYTEAQAAAACFGELGKPRRLRVDAMIAGTAMIVRARLATNNQRDFIPFVAHGLELF